MRGGRRQAVRKNSEVGRMGEIRKSGGVEGRDMKGEGGTRRREEGRKSNE